MNKNMTRGFGNPILKQIAISTLLFIAALITPTVLTSCEIDDALPGGGSGGGSHSSNQFVGTWSRQVQWAYTDGTREETFILRSGGAGTYKSWDWGDQRYYTTPLTWSASGDVIVISRKATQDYSWSDAYGYINSSGNAMKINGDWYNKK